MDFLAQQSIAFSKKLRDELATIKQGLSSLRGDLQDQTKAIRESSDATQKHRDELHKIITEPHLPASVETHKSAEDTTSDNQYQRWTLWLQVLTLIALVGYSTLVYLQWREMI